MRSVRVTPLYSPGDSTVRRSTLFLSSDDILLACDRQSLSDSLYLYLCLRLKVCRMTRHVMCACDAKYYFKYCRQTVYCCISRFIIFVIYCIIIHIWYLICYQTASASMPSACCGNGGLTYVCRLVCGDVRGRFAQLFTRVSSIQKKAGQFDVILILLIFTARCYASAVLAMGLCLCLSVTSQCSTKTAKRRIAQTTPHDSPGTLVFGCQRSPRNSTGITPCGGAKYRWGGSKSATFDK